MFREMISCIERSIVNVLRKLVCICYTIDACKICQRKGNNKMYLGDDFFKA